MIEDDCLSGKVPEYDPVHVYLYYAFEGQGNTGSPLTPPGEIIVNYIDSSDQLHHSVAS